jgi:hypothetical protein
MWMGIEEKEGTKEGQFTCCKGGSHSSVFS